jgi:hypothetical protein
LSLAVLDPRTGDTLRTLRVPARSAAGPAQDYRVSFQAREKGGIRLRFRIPAGASIDVDWIDIAPAEGIAP